MAAESDYDDDEDNDDDDDVILMGSSTVEELLSLVLPPKQSLDQDLDPCKSPAFLGDIVYPEANLTIIKVIRILNSLINGDH